MSRQHILASVCLMLAAVFGWLFCERYWKWRDCIHEAASSCITPVGRSVISGGMLWGLAAGALAAAAVRLALRRRGS